MRCRLLVVVLVLAAGCGDDDDDDGSALLATSSSSATTLLPVPAACPVGDDAVGGLVGVAVTSAFESTARSATCTWTFSDGSVTLNLERGGGATAHERYDQIAGVVAIDGLGDDATWVPSQGVLSVLDGADVYMVLVAGVDDPQPVATEVARLALAGS